MRGLGVAWWGFPNGSGLIPTRPDTVTYEKPNGRSGLRRPGAPTLPRYGLRVRAPPPAPASSRFSRGRSATRRLRSSTATFASRRASCSMPGERAPTDREPARRDRRSMVLRAPGPTAQSIGFQNPQSQPLASPELNAGRPTDRPFWPRTPVPPTETEFQTGHHPGQRLSSQPAVRTYWD